MYVMSVFSEVAGHSFDDRVSWKDFLLSEKGFLRRENNLYVGLNDGWFGASLKDLLDLGDCRSTAAAMSQQREPWQPSTKDRTDDTLRPTPRCFSMLSVFGH